jgi:ComF family protein
VVCGPCFAHLPLRVDTEVEAEDCHLRLNHTPYFQRCIALYTYGAAVQTLIHFFKYKGGRSLAIPFGRALAASLSACDQEVDALIPVPLHRSRLRDRGYNQSEKLASAVAENCGVPVWGDVLIRRKSTLPQARMDRTQRLNNLRQAFCVRYPERLQGRSLVLVDDVLTTGHTLDECARVLIEAGAASVFTLTIARVD